MPPHCSRVAPDERVSTGIPGACPGCEPVCVGRLRLPDHHRETHRREKAHNPSCPGWAAEAYLAITPDNETDFDRIESDILQLCRRFRVVSVGTDPWQAANLSQRLRAEGVNMVDFRTTRQNFSPAIVELDAAMRSGRLRHDGDPVLEWCVGNVVGRPDRRGNLYPAKQRPEQKIDAAVALMMAVGRAMAEDTNEGEQSPDRPADGGGRSGSAAGRGRPSV